MQTFTKPFQAHKDTCSYFTGRYRYFVCDNLITLDCVIMCHSIKVMERLQMITTKCLDTFVCTDRQNPGDRIWVLAVYHKNIGKSYD